MAIIDNIKDTISKTGKSAVKKTKDLAGIAKITADIEETKNLLKGVYEEIGKKYCEVYDKDSAGEDFSVNVATVATLIERLESLKAERLALRGKVQCPGCGKSADNGYAFCPYCGTKLPEKPADEDVEEISEDEIEIEVVDTKEPPIPDEDEEITDEE